jgi:sec-independent protein translocase protein TatA
MTGFSPITGALFGLGPMELGIIVLVILLLFGPKRLPEMGKAIGQTIKEMKKTQKEITEEKDEDKPEKTEE